jgi:hypothetical protein
MRAVEPARDSVVFWLSTDPLVATRSIPDMPESCAVSALESFRRMDLFCGAGAAFREEGVS